MGRGKKRVEAGTGNFNNIGGGTRFMDNILYGVKDPDYPLFKHLNGVVIPEQGSDNFITTAHQGANSAYSVDDADVCIDMSDELLCENGPKARDQAWVVHLDTVDGKQPNDPTTVNTYRKLSATPTLFKGQVYFPIYEPPPGTNPCDIGMAYICVADDECGTNNSHLLTKGGAKNARACKEIRQGILSELVIFGDQLFANVAGPKEDADTLYSILSAVGDVTFKSQHWRESGF